MRRTPKTNISLVKMAKTRKSGVQSSKGRPRKTPLAAKHLVSTEQEDCLKQDHPIMGQAYVCMSFVSAEDVVVRKDSVFFDTYVRETILARIDSFVDATNASPGSVAEFAKSFKHEMSDTVLDFQAYLATNRARLEEAYAADHPQQITISGFKVRGSYPDVETAKKRAEALQHEEKGVDVFVAQVGAWCPFNPSAESVGDVVYDETELNTLMKLKREAEAAKDSAYSDGLPQRINETRQDASVSQAPLQTVVEESEDDDAT